MVKKLLGSCFRGIILIPSDYRAITRILEGAISLPSVALVRRGCAGYLFNNRELRALRHDGAYKVPESLTGHPTHCASVRKYAETGDLRNRHSAERLRVVRTLRALSGAAIGASGRLIGSRSATIAFFSSALGSGRRNYASACEVVFNDLGMDLDRRSTWGVSPNLIAV